MRKCTLLRSDANYAKDHTIQKIVHKRKKGKFWKKPTIHISGAYPSTLEDSKSSKGQDSTLARNNGKFLRILIGRNPEESLTKSAESAKRHEENSNIIKEIRASTDAAIRNQRASIKTLEIQVEQMSKVLQKRRHTAQKPISEVVPFPRRLQNYSCDDWREAQDGKILDTYDHSLPQKEKDPGSFTLPCFIHNICFDKALV
ncbi:hypothetical protein Tco_0853156 [Tanacetum coccineum]